MPEYEKEAALYTKLADGRVRCCACARRCSISTGLHGACGMRVNRGGRLMAPWGYVSGLAADPVEKKPFFHVLPGARTLSFGMLGCNYTCDFCQNWNISSVRSVEGDIYAVSPSGLVARAGETGARILVSTYNEPVITAEWGAAIFAEAKKKGLLTAFVSNGYATAETVDFMKPLLDLWKVDLKSFDRDKFSAACGAELRLALAGLEMIVGGGFWVEIVTLLIPGFNDSESEIAEMAGYISGLSRDIPWHVTAFHPAYRRTGVPAQSDAVLRRAREIGQRKGLNYVYCGNSRDAAGTEDTSCPSCGMKLVRRQGFTVISDLLGGKGTCRCGRGIPGVWKQP